MVGFSRLERNWVEWTGMARMNGVSISTQCEDCEILFTADDQSFHLRRDTDWWVVDKVDDRNQRHNSLARFSAFDLAEKYLIWRWSSVTRSAIGAKPLGARLQSLGMAPNVDAIPTDREGAVELRTSDGSAVVPRSTATIFSHLMSKSVDEVERMAKDGVA
ncbi:hypothetical protein NIIDNTM18_08890 [Mycolicibacterium litorale]|uniref:Uncharacterized protein n=1 Tax=Mycolicibacterium litorale TaxID=758802 RepID=A0A6S6P228_9MYCO|nr:hypothetical protein NIIDNTM18_08890 [Mycolicibacterium litorale]